MAVDNSSPSSVEQKSSDRFLIVFDFEVSLTTALTEITFEGL
jgi:hypothetical protein